MTCAEVLNTLIDCYSFEDFNYTCDLLLKREDYPDTSKLNRIERIEFFRRKKEIQMMLAENDGIQFKPIYSLQRLKALERMAKLGGTKSNINSKSYNKSDNTKEVFYKRLNKLL